MMGGGGGITLIALSGGRGRREGFFLRQGIQSNNDNGVGCPSKKGSHLSCDNLEKG